HFQAAPLLPGSSMPPMRAMVPSPERATLSPKEPSLLVSPVPLSLLPCCFQLEPERLKIHAALAPKPPRRAVLPSLESATLFPNSSSPLLPFPVSFLPCCFQLEPERAKTQAAPGP